MGNCDFVKCVNTCKFLWFLHHHVMCICKENEYVYMENGFVSCLREKNVSVLERKSVQTTFFFFFFSVSLNLFPHNAMVTLHL